MNYKRRFRFYPIVGMSMLFAIAPLAAAPAKDDPYAQAMAQLKNKDPKVRRQGAEALGRIRNLASVDTLKKLLTDESPAVRSQVTETLGLMRVVAVSSDIARMLSSDNDPGARQMAAIALGYIADRNTVPALMKGLKDPYEGVRFASVNSLGILRDDSAAMALVQELRSPDARMRSSCAYALGNIASRVAVPGLLDSIKVSLATAPATNEGYLMDIAVGASAIRSLGLIGDPSVIPIIKKYADHKDKKVKVNAAQALFKLGDKSGLPVARLFLKDSDSYNRRVSAEIVGELGDEKDLAALKKMKGDADESVNQSVTVAIDRITRRTAASKPAPVKKSPASAPRK